MGSVYWFYHVLNYFRDPALPVQWAMPPYKHFDCPHCEAAVPVELSELQAASAALPCPGCALIVYVIAGKLSNFQPGNTAAAYDVSYDPGQ